MIKDLSQSSNLPSKKGRVVKIGEASKILGLHVDTLRRWEKSGKITTVRTPGGTRLYSLDELNSLVPQGAKLDLVPQDAKLRLIPKVPDNVSKPSTKIKQLPVEENIYIHIYNNGVVESSAYNNGVVESSAYNNGVVESSAYNNGVDKRIIFNGEEDYAVFLGFLKDYLTAPQDPESIKKDFTIHGRIFQGTPHQPKNYFNQVELIAYSLMPDHFHLLLHQVTKGSTESFLRSLCTRYSMYFNKKYQRTGALFEGPYKSITIKDESRLPYLTRYLHQGSRHSSYLEYVGSRETSWVKVKKGTDDYKDFVEKEYLEGIILENETAHLPPKPIESSNLKPLQRIPEFLATTVVFLLLLALGIRNIVTSTITSPKPSPSPSVLSTTKKVEEVKPKRSTIKIDGSDSIIIRQNPTADAEIISLAKTGDTFEIVSKNSGWYEIKLSDGLTGFIYATFAVAEEQITNE